MDPSIYKKPAGRLIRSPRNFWAFQPNPLPPDLDWTAELINMLSTADRSLGELAGLGLTLPNPFLFIRPMMRLEAVLSSRIEGTRASLSDLYAYEAVQLSYFNGQTDVQEVHNYVRALEYGLERLETLPLSLRLVREMHSVLMDGVRGGYQTPGEFRRSQNWVGPPGCTLENATFVPPPVEEMHQALDALEKFLHSSSNLPPLVRLALIHYQFEAIHPFLDGNGRIGRLLITLLSIVWELLPRPCLFLSSYLEAKRQTYYDRLLAVSATSAWEDWLLFFLQGVASQSRDMIRRVQQLQALRSDVQQKYQSERAAGRLMQAVDLLFERPILTTNQVKDRLGVDFSTAQRYVNRLELDGLLREITGRARNRIYRADKVMGIIEDVGTDP
ncbi:MAG: Fic family protein [Anaerolineales bacterium]|nr:Fic family protein [Anaerolineales bacterium]